MYLLDARVPLWAYDKRLSIHYKHGASMHQPAARGDREEAVINPERSRDTTAALRCLVEIWGMGICRVLFVLCVLRLVVAWMNFGSCNECFGFPGSHLTTFVLIWGVPGSPGSPQ